MSWTEADLKRQFDTAVSEGWLMYFQNSASQHDFTVELLMAIASRETAMRNIKGDLRGGIYHGYGVMQVDIGTNADFCKNWTENEVEGSIECGTKILLGKRKYLAGKNITDLKAMV